MTCVIDTEAAYRRALEKLNRFVGAGEKSESSPRMAELEAAIARYVNKPGEPAHRTGRPRTNRP